MSNNFSKLFILILINFVIYLPVKTLAVPATPPVANIVRVSQAKTAPVTTKVQSTNPNPNADNSVQKNDLKKKQAPESQNLLFIIVSVVAIVLILLFSGFSMSSSGRTISFIRNSITFGI